MSLIDLGSKYFTWAEVLASQTAARRGLDNTPEDETQATIVQTAKHMDAVRALLGTPVLVSSWFRALKVNTAVGSRPTSQHVKGEALDFTSPKFGSVEAVFAFLKARMVDFGIDQLILEYGAWVHISFTATPRHMALTIDNKGTRAA
ncbi:MAG: D-Ala-D-Ala carboxypeptidase family metallohydrolase [Gemmatimonadales bacterium]|nr:D-Ala-D-Ala carboxypeptidase family metallohydrolase [Gemmatimonadales bacterium]